jgi:hypothetical protein
MQQAILNAATRLIDEEGRRSAPAEKITSFVQVTERFAPFIIDGMVDDSICPLDPGGIAGALSMRPLLRGPLSRGKDP